MSKIPSPAGLGNAASPACLPAWRAFRVPVFLAKETHEGSQTPYRTAALDSLFTVQPADRPKDGAPGFLPTLYNAPDARNHETQRAHGRFVALTADIDTGDYPLTEIERAARGFAGDAAWLVYSSSSSRPGNRKWRIIIPLSKPIAFPEWFAAQTVFHDEWARAGIEPDRSLARSGQPVFAPNVPGVHVAKDGTTTVLRGEDGAPLYFERTASSLDAPGLDLARSWLLLEIQEVKAQREADEALRQAARAEAAQRREALGPGSTIIERFNAANDLTDLLLKYGYEDSPSNDLDWRSPHQKSGSYATRVMDGSRWVSLSQSDKEAGLGRAIDSGCHGDAFDLLAHYEHGGDAEAALAALRSDETAQDFAGVVLPELPATPEKGERASKFRIRAINELEHEASRIPVIKGLIARGDFVCIFGQPGSGKSVLAPYLALRVAQGLLAFGMRTAAGPVIYIGAEDPHGMGQRLRALAKAYGDAASLHLATGVAGVMIDPKAPEMLDLLECIARLGPALVIIDTLAVGFPIDENASREMSAVVQICRMIADQGPAIVLVHHSPKGDASTPRGHSVLNGALDTSIRVDPADTAGNVRCTCMKNRNGFPQRFAFKIRSESLGRDADGDAITAPVCEEVDYGSLPQGVKMSAAKSDALNLLDSVAGPSGRAALDSWRQRCAAPGAISRAQGEESRLRAFQRVKRDLLAANIIATGTDEAGVEWVARKSAFFSGDEIAAPEF